MDFACSTTTFLFPVPPTLPPPLPWSPFPLLSPPLLIVPLFFAFRSPYLVVRKGGATGKDGKREEKADGLSLGSLFSLSWELCFLLPECGSLCLKGQTVPKSFQKLTHPRHWIPKCLATNKIRLCRDRRQICTFVRQPLTYQHLLWLTNEEHMGTENRAHTCTGATTTESFHSTVPLALSGKGLTSPCWTLSDRVFLSLPLLFFFFLLCMQLLFSFCVSLRSCSLSWSIKFRLFSCLAGSALA